MKLHKNQYKVPAILFEESTTEFCFEEKAKTMKEYYFSGVTTGFVIISVILIIVNVIREVSNV